MAAPPGAFNRLEEGITQAVMESFSIFHLYLLFFLLGLGYAAIAVVLGQIGGGDGHGADGHAGDTHSEAGHGGHAHGHGSGVDAHPAETLPSLSPLSPVFIATFFTGFGGIGLVLDRAGLSGILSIPAAAFAGLILAAGTFSFFSRVFRSVQSSSGVSGRQAIGASARVITPIPESGTGEIAYVVGGRRFNGPARGLEGRAFAKDAEVVIVERGTGLFVVREKAQPPLNDDEERRQVGES